MTKIAANPDSLIATARSLLDARQEYDGVGGSVRSNSVRLAAAPNAVTAQVAVGVAEFSAHVKAHELRLWNESQTYALTAVKFKVADGSADPALLATIGRLYGPGAFKAIKRLDKGLRLGVKFGVKWIAHHPSNVPDIKRLEKLKPAYKASKALGKFTGTVSKLLTAKEIATEFNRGADAQFQRDVRRDDLSPWQQQARAALAGLAEAAESLGELGGSAAATALAGILGATGAICGLIGTPVGSVVGGIVGFGVGWAAGMLGGAVGKRIGRMLASRLRALIDSPVLNHGQAAHAGASGGW